MSAKRYGAWFGSPNAGGSNINPYRKATLARTGAMQLGRAEGIVFTATHDDDGGPLEGACQYLISGNTPSASVWTLRAVPANSKVKTKGVAYVTSMQVNRDADSSFEVVTAPSVKPGNWLPTVELGRMKFILSFYDTNAFLVVGHEAAGLRTLAKAGCS